MVKNNGILSSLKGWVGLHGLFHLHNLIILTLFPADDVTFLQQMPFYFMVFQDFIAVVLYHEIGVAREHRRKLGLVFVVKDGFFADSADENGGSFNFNFFINSNK